MLYQSTDPISHPMEISGEIVWGLTSCSGVLTEGLFEGGGRKASRVGGQEAKTDTKVVDTLVRQHNLPARRPRGLCGEVKLVLSLSRWLILLITLILLSNGQLVFYLFQLIQVITRGNKHLLPLFC